MTKTSEMNRHEYEFMTGKWEGVKGAAYNQVYEFCKELGWLMGLSDHGEPIPTAKGTDAIRRFKESENITRIDVV